MSKSRRIIRRLRALSAEGKEPTLFQTAILSRPYIPARGIPYSLLIHDAVFTVLIFLRVSHGSGKFMLPEPRAVVIDEPEQRVVMYLPLRGGGHEGMGSEGRGLPGGGLPARRKGTAGASAPGKKGLSYPGPQRILSDFLNPTNRSQTLLQPALVKPPVLPPPLSLPNIVRMADAGPKPQKKPYVPIVKPPEAIKPAQPPAPPPPAATLAMPAPVDEQKLIQPANIPKTGPLPEIKYPEPTPSLKPPEQVVPEPAPQDANVVEPPEPPPMPPEPIRIDCSSRFWLATTPALLSLRPAVAQRRGSVSIRAPAWGATPAP